MKTVPHKRHRHSEGPGYYKWVIAGIAAVGLLHLCYRVTGTYFSGLGGALLTAWILLPVFGGMKVGASGLISGGLAALVGSLLLLANYWFPYVGYLGWETRPAILILLVAPVIHWVFVFTVSVLIRALGRR